MKKSIMLIIILGLFFSLISINITTAEDNPLDNGVVGYWSLDNSSGNIAIDLSPNYNNGTLVNMEDGDWITGKLNNCLIFDGVDEYIACGNIANFDRYDIFSLECWFKTLSSNIMVMFSKFDTAVADGYQVFMMEGILFFEMGNTPTKNIFVGIEGKTFNDDVWYHMVVTKDNSGDATGIHIYINNMDESLTVYSDDISGSCLNSVDFRISSLDVVTPEDVWDGNIDEVVIYNKVLNESEIDYRYNNGNGRGYFPDEPPNNPPNKPINPTPSNNATNVLFDTTLKIYVVDRDNNNMSVSIYWNNDTLIETINNISNNTHAETFSLSLNYNMTYSWYTISNDSELENTSNTFTFTTMELPNSPPNKPICIYPVDKTTHVNIDTTFRVKVIDNDNDTMNLSFYLDDIFIEKFFNIFNNTIVESANLSLDYSKIYTWYTVVEDEYNLNTSDSFIFATTCEPEPIIPNISPEKPVLIFPDNNSINISKFTRLKTNINDVDDDFLYVSFYWENNSEIQSLFSITNYTIQTATLNLEYNISYSWYVIVTDFIDYNISDIYTFTTEIEIIEDEDEDDDIIPPTALETDYSILLIGICLAIFVFILEFFSNKLKIEKTKLLSVIELALILIIISIMIFLKLS